MDGRSWLDWVREWPGDDRWRERVDDPEEPELLLLEELRNDAPAQRSFASTGFRVDSVELSGAYPDTEIVVEFRAMRRYPDRTFVRRWRLWDHESQWDSSVFWANLIELVDAADITLPGGPGERVLLQ